MSDKEVLVSFRPLDVDVYVLPGTRLVEAAAEAGIILEMPCGGEGLCGNCRVLVASGAAEPTDVESDWLSADELQAGWRLACQSRVQGPMEIVVPRTSQAAAPKILTEKTEKGSGVFTEAAAALHFPDPLVKKQFVELPIPARDDDMPDLIRLERAIGAGPLEIDVPLLKEIPARLREANFQGTAVLADGRLLDFEPGNTETDAFAVVVDLGTTTVVAELLDLGVGARWAVEAKLNPQIRFGDDVLSRILYARQNSDGARQLHETIVAVLDEMIGELCRKAGIPRERIYALGIAGNTTMQQLFCGVDVRPLGEVPFTPATGRGMICRAAELGVQIHPHADAYVMPVIGGFVGGDTVAGILATDLADAQSPTLFIDIGTNGEIALLADGKLSAASTAAGPAFEGARILCGMRGSAGAIEKVVFDDGRLQTNVIGNVSPAGLCGSGLIDLAAELLRHGLVTPQGRMLARDQLPDGMPNDLADRIISHNGQTAFLLASAAEAADNRPIVLTQRDIRELQLAAGAIRAGIVILLRRAGLKPSDLDHLLIGGGFGNFIRRSNAQRIGLLPSEVEHRRIRYMGNTSLSGIRLATLSHQARETAERLARCTEHVDLSSDAGFQHEFAEAMLFPES